MRSRALLTLTLLFMIASLAAGCLPAADISKRSQRRTYTLTPFLPKATFTETPQGVKVAADIQPTSTEKAAGEEGQSATNTSSAPQNTATKTAKATQEKNATPLPTDTAAPTATAKPTTKPTEKSSAFTATPKPKKEATATKAPSKTPKEPTKTTAPTATKEQAPPPATATSKPTATSEPPTNTPQPTATPQESGCSYSGNATYESQVIDLINKERKERGLPALSMNSSLRKAARRHSQDMACNDLFSHTGSDGSTLGSRLLAAGYSYSYAAENIAASSSQNFSPQSVVKMWMNSSGHKKNILSEKVIHIGVGFRYVSDSDSQDMDAYYTADFGHP